MRGPRPVGGPVGGVPGAGAEAQVRGECGAASGQVSFPGVWAGAGSDESRRSPWRSSGLGGSEGTGTRRGERRPGGGGGRLGGQNPMSKTKNMQSVASARDGDTFATAPPRGPTHLGMFPLPPPGHSAHPSETPPTPELGGAAVLPCDPWPWPRLKCCSSPRKEEAGQGQLAGYQGPLPCPGAAAGLPQPAAEVRGGGLHQCRGMSWAQVGLQARVPSSTRSVLRGGCMGIWRRGPHCLMDGVTVMSFVPISAP